MLLTLLFFFNLFFSFTLLTFSYFILRFVIFLSVYFFLCIK
jgi:hypothetical protein